MPRPKNADSTRTHEGIVEATRRLLRTSGIEAAELSMRAVAAEAGVSLGTVQYYFGSKAELFEAVVEEHYQRIDTLVAPLLARYRSCPSGDDARALIEDTVRSLYRFAVDERDCVDLRSATRASLGELHPRSRERVLGPILDLGAAALAPMVEGADERECRLMIQSMIFAASRYVLLGDAEVETITKLGAAEGRRAIEDHLVGLATRMVFGGPVPRP